MLKAPSGTSIHIFHKPEEITFHEVKAQNLVAYTLNMKWDETALTLFFHSAIESIETIEELIKCLENLKTNLQKAASVTV